VTNFVDIYQRLTEAGAARLVTGPDTLSEAVHELMNPDKAASMAHAAWEVVSQGAEVTDRALDAIFHRLDAGPAARGRLTCARLPSGTGRRG
jgi:3-deoxy-D-manno-octulosonic-acid transferase